MVTKELLQAICPKTKNSVLEQYTSPLTEVALYYDMNENPNRLAGFLAQTAHESGGFNIIKENLNYSADGLRKIFGKYFPTVELAMQYARKPQLIGSRVYANRMGNGTEASGDGYKFCGRGLIQLTGKSNYTKFADSLSITIDECVAYLETVPGACSSAGWFWDTNKLNAYCDANDFIGLTKRINGGTNGLAERQHYYQIALAFIKG